MTKGKTNKQIPCKIRMLDDQELPFHVDVSTRSMSYERLSFIIRLNVESHQS